MKPRSIVTGIVLTLAVSTSATQVTAAQTRLADSGKADMPVVISESASEQVRDAAHDLARYLGRMTGATFDIVIGNGKQGLAVGSAADFPGIQLNDAFDAPPLVATEQYVIRSHEHGVYLIGAADLGAQHAVWDFLYRLGYRQFFPGETWEIVPEHPTLGVDMQINQRPDYAVRSIWFGYGFWDHNRETYARWQKRNRGVSDFQLRTGHAWGQIQRRHAETFEEHPEYFALVDGKREDRSNAKFEIANESLRALIVDNRLAELERNPEVESVSIDPSDGGGWSESPEAAAMGSISDQMVTLGNEVAAAIVDRFGEGKYVGFYAYNEHSPPPSIQIHPNVIVSIATSFIRGGYTVDDLIRGWANRGATIGVREYYSVYVWDRDLPGRASGSDLQELAHTIPHYYRMGARFMSAESSDNWGPNGLGYYLAQRMLWDINEANNIDALIDDFIHKAFRDAAPPMFKFYRLIDGSNNPLLSDDLIGRMYRLLDEASSMTDDPDVQQRLDSLILYTRYVELFRAYDATQGSDRQAAFERVVRFAYRIRNTQMVHTAAIYRSLQRDRRVTIPEGAAWHVSEEQNPWKSSEPFSRQALNDMVRQGIARHDLLTFTPVAFDRDLVPATPLGLTGADTPRAGTPQVTGRGTQKGYTWVEHAPTTIKLHLTGGLIRHYRDRGDVVVNLFPSAEVQGLSVAEGSVPPDGETREVNLATTHAGLHRIEYNDGNDMTRMQWSPGAAMTFEMSTDFTARLQARNTLYFYVPRNTQTLGGYIHSGHGTLRDGENHVIHQFDNHTGFIAIPIPPGQDASLWQLQAFKGRLRLMTVPPFVALHPHELLLPREVVESEQR